MNKFKIVEQGLKYYGVKSIPGELHEENIVGFFNKSGHLEIKDDETPWCSAFINAICSDLNLPKSGLLNARSWLKMGKEITVPEMGDIVIFWRESPTSWKGHVAIFIKEDDQSVWVLGGNQGNQVNILEFPKSKILGFRDISV